MKEFSRLPKEKLAPRAIMVGGSVDRCSVCLRAFGEHLDPTAVSDLLRAAATLSCRKGDITHGKTGDRVEQQGKWLLSIDQQRGVSLEIAINQLLDKITDDLAAWRELVTGFRVDLFCGLYLEQSNRGLDLSPQTLRRIADRGINLDLDIYYVGDDVPI